MVLAALFPFLTTISFTLILPTIAGGVAIYVSKDINAKFEIDYQFQAGGCENLFFSLKMGNKKFIVRVVYKHPDVNKIFFLTPRENIAAIQPTSVQLRSSK